MNREILFRGKRLDNSNWVEGFVYEHEPPIQCITPDNYVAENSKWYICKTAFADWNMPRQVEFVEVDKSTIGQFCGLTDKNGKKMFEGDIIRVIYESDRMPENVPETWAELYTVVFDDNYHAWYTKSDDGELGEWLYEYDGDCEIIGNIHENPELLGTTL